MAVNITGTFKPAGDFPVVESVDVVMPDGSRLSEYNPGSGLPEVSASDNGKVLGVVNGAWKSVTPEIPEELPSVTTSDNGKVLGVVSGKWAKVTPEHPKELPAVTTSDNGKVLAVVGGKWQSVTPEIPDVQSEIPVFNLSEKGLTAVTLPEGQSVAEADTADIVEALGNGEVKFAVPVSMSGVTIPVYLTMQGFTDGSGMYQCSAMVMMEELLFVLVVVQTGGIAVQVKPFTNFIDDYLRSALEGDY